LSELLYKQYITCNLRLGETNKDFPQTLTKINQQVDLIRVTCSNVLPQFSTWIWQSNSNKYV